VIDYPIHNGPYKKKIYSSNGLYSREFLVKNIADAYQTMYAEEETTTTLPVEPCFKRYSGCFLINRAKTDGKWGHDLEDLCLSNIQYDGEDT